jgi:cytochrome o ubiquinol oxidase subunit 3
MSKKEMQENTEKSKLGFWLYLMSDCVLFGSFFAVYAVLRNNTYGGPASNEIFNLYFVLIETMLLLFSSFTVGLAVLSARNGEKVATRNYLLVTGVLGLAFLGMELFEFNHLLGEGYSWTTSASLSAFYGLVGLHGLHIVAGIIWLLVMLWLIRKRGLIDSTSRRLELFAMYWHFLDIVWIFIFTFVYAMGVAR